MAPPPPSLRLVVLPVSPWSERARWALDHHRLAHEEIEHVPFLGELRLRRLAGPGRQATVPILIADDRTITDSWDIARYADRAGRGEPLIPEGREADVRSWNELSDATKRAGRALLMAAMLESPAALDEGFPPPVPRAIRPLLRPVARFGSRWFGRKYGLRFDEAPAQMAVLRATFTKVREALAKGSPYLLGGAFSYADIVMATCLQAVKPVDNRYIALGPATRQVWTRDDLAEEFSDLIAWRDGLYEKHRKPRAPTAPG
jgi:glutathione S-transferase